MPMLPRLLLRARPILAASAGAAAATIAVSSASDRRIAHNDGFFGLGGKPKVHLKYFDIQGAAETIRCMLAFGGFDWSESAWPIDYKKFDGPESLRLGAGPCPKFADAAANEELSANLGRVPILIVDGKHEIGQSKAIERFLAKKAGLMGSGSVEAAQIEAMTEHVRDIKDQYHRIKGDIVETGKFFEFGMPEFMHKLELAVELASPGKGPALVGSKISYADLTLFVFISDYFTNFGDKESALNAIKKCPRLHASFKAVAEHPAIKKYRASRTSKSK